MDDFRAFDRSSNSAIDCESELARGRTSNDSDSDFMDFPLDSQIVQSFPSIESEPSARYFGIPVYAADSLEGVVVRRRLTCGYAFENPLHKRLICCDETTVEGGRFDRNRRIDGRGVSNPLFEAGTIGGFYLLKLV